MSAPKWTPGPWFASDKHGKVAVYARDRWRSWVATLDENASFSQRDPDQYEQALSDAALVAAAPELYQALEQWQRVFEDHVAPLLEGTEVSYAIECVVACAGRDGAIALAKARGEEVGP